MQKEGGGGEEGETQRRKEDREERLVSACPLLAARGTAAPVQSAKKNKPDSLLYVLSAYVHLHVCRCVSQVGDLLSLVAY